MRFAFAFAFALAACGTEQSDDADAGPEVDAGLVEDGTLGQCDTDCVDNSLVVNWFAHVGPAEQQVTCCACRRQVSTIPITDVCETAGVDNRIDRAAETCSECRDLP